MNPPDPTPSPSRPSPTRSLPTPWFLLACAALLLFWALSIPTWNPAFPIAPNVDYAWFSAIDYANAHHMPFSSRILFTYGPLGYLGAPIYPTHGFAWSILIRLALVTWYVLAIARLNINRNVPWPITLIGLTLLLVAPLQGVTYDPSNWLLAILMLLRLLDASDNHSPLDTTLTIVGIFLLSVLSLTKFTHFIIAGIVLFAMALSLSLTPAGRKKLWLPLLFIPFLLLMWTLSGEPLSGLWNFIITRLQVSSAHSQSSGTPDATVELLAFSSALVSLACWAWLAGSHPQASKTVKIIVALTGALITFFTFKAGVVRAGPVTASTIGYSLICIALLWTLGAPAPRPLPRALAIALTAAALAITICFGQWVVNPVVPGWFTRIFTVPVARAQNALALAQDPSLLSRQYQDRKAAVAQQWPIPQEMRIPTTDIIGNDQQILILNDVNYHPRPSIQNYFIGAPSLLAVNTDFFKSQNAPDQLLISTLEIDNRYPLLTLGPNLLPLLSHYQTLERLHHYVILQKLPTPLTLQLTPIANLDILPGVSTPLPPEAHTGLIWAQLDYTPPATAAALNFLLRTPRLKISVNTREGLPEFGTASPAQLSAGFLLSPYATDQYLRSLWRLGLAGKDMPKQLTALTLDIDAPPWQQALVKAPMKLHLYKITAK
jgi:hypothetical protein